MSTKNEVLGKENRKEKGHRRYSLLLLALLFIGFASYGTYAYFSSSTSTENGQLTLNGLDSSYEVDEDYKDNQNTGDGTTNKDTDNKYEYNPDPDGNGKFVEVVDKGDTSQDEAHNSTQFGEFPWVYVGNNGAVDVDSDKLLNQSFDLRKFNGHVLATDDKNTEFKNVVEGDVFRKTVRLAVNGTSKVPMTAKITWKNEDGESTANIIGGAFYRTAAQVNDAAAAFNLTEFKHAFDLTSADAKEIGKVKSGDFIDVELVVAVREGANTEAKAKDKAEAKAEAKANVLPNLAKISRQLEISLVQETSNVLKDK